MLLDFVSLIDKVNSFVWGPYMLVLIVGTGVYLTLRLGFLQIRTLPYALKLAFSPAAQDKTSKGDISHFQALATALAATIGTGNIAGVATAIFIGGPGAVFWMWLTAVFGMATKYGEAILAVKYRVMDEAGEMAGGPMYYLERGLKNKKLGKILGILFALFGGLASFGIGNMTQTNSVASAVNTTFNVSPIITGIVIAIFTALVILGGIKSIGRVTAFFVPIMAVFYVLGGLIVLCLHFDLIGPALQLILSDAFTGQAAAGGALGTVIRYGVARGVFSNEAGLGSAPIAAAAAKTDHPGRQALVSMTGTFLDTIIVCSVTGLVITIAQLNLYASGAVPEISGPALSIASFDALLPGGIGKYLVTIGLIFFAYSTVLGWSYYGEKCLQYLFSRKAILPYRLIFVVFTYIGCILKLDLVWNIADTLNGAMAIPNLIGLLVLSGVIASETKDFMAIRNGEIQAALTSKSLR